MTGLGLHGLGALGLALALGAAPMAAPAQSAVVAVQISGFRGTQGVALVTLYASEDAWLHLPKAAQVIRAKLTGPTLTVRFVGVKPGTYAVGVVHDANQNDKLDMRWFPWPKPLEGAGVSNNPAPRHGPPLWSDAKFQVGTTGATVPISVRDPG